MGLQPPDRQNLVRSSALVLLAIAALIVPGLDNRAILVSVLCAAIPSQFIAERAFDPNRALVAVACHDVALAALLPFLVPAIWTPTAITISASLVWLGLITETRVVAVLSISALAVLGVSGHASGFSMWLPTWVTTVCVVLSFGLNGLQHQRERRELQQNLDEVLDSANVAVHFCDLDAGRVSLISGPIERITGWSADRWATMDHRSLVHPDDLDSYWLDPARVKHGQRIDRVARFRRIDGTYAWLRDVSRVERRGNSLQLHGLTIDVSELGLALENAEYRSDFDQLTGLGNRTWFARNLELRLNQPGPFALLLLDLNRFKEINDTLGHAFGDRILVSLAHRMNATLFGSAIARLGGDEFGILVEGTDSAAADAAADRLAAVIREPIDVDGVRVATSAAIGVVLPEDHPSSGVSMMRWADIAMYAAKARRVPVCRFTTDLEHTSLSDLLLTGQIEQAISAGDIVIHLQPKVDLTTGTVLGAEALARWNHADYGTLGADQFIDLINVSDHVPAFTAHILDSALRAIQTCRMHGLELGVSINVTVRTLLDTSFADLVRDRCLHFGVAPTALTVELTEDAAMETSGTVPDVLQRLHELGVKLSVDDFGAGHSSFARLPNLPIDEIKIDRQFLWSMATEPRNAVILKSIIDLARGLGHHVVAEGVETAEQADYLRRHGCTTGQGYYFGHAVPVDTFIAAATQGASTATTAGVTRVPMSDGMMIDDDRLTQVPR